MSASRFLQGQGSFVKKQMLNMKRQHRSLQKKATIPMTMEVAIVIVFVIVIVIVMMMSGGIKPQCIRKTIAAFMATTAATTTTQKNAAK
jgi:hypothetical protein